MGLKRPAWTLCLGFIAALLVPGAILTHLAVTELLPAIEDLPANIVKGFDEVFKFATLEQSSTTLRSTCATEVAKCNNLVASTQCNNVASIPLSNNVYQNTINTAAAKVTITQIFADNLAIVDRVANDKYLGTAELKETGKNLNTVQAEIKKIKNNMKCYEAVPTFCEIYKSADSIVTGMAVVTDGINKFKTSDIVKRWEDNTDIITLLHALPYFMVLSMCFYACFIWKGGVCCCCRGGTVCGTLALIPYALLYLVSFIIYVIVCAVGVTIKYFPDQIEVPVLNGKPTLDQAIDHIETAFPKFWSVVFADLADGLDMLLTASFFFVACQFLIAVYAYCECCCCPYREKLDLDKEAEKSAKEAEKATAEANQAQQEADKAQADADKAQAEVDKLNNEVEESAV